MKTRQKIRKAVIFISFLLFPVTMFYLSPALIVMGALRDLLLDILRRPVMVAPKEFEAC